MEFIFNDYNNWKQENEDLISTLINNKSEIIRRFKHVYDCVEFFANEISNDIKLNDDEMQIFESGFNYLYDQFQNIQIFLEHFFNNDIKEMENYSELINLYLYALDFESELLNKENVKEEDNDALNNYIDKVFELIKEKKEANLILHEELDEISFRIFKNTYYGINEIFLDIDDELGIIDYE